MAEPRSTVVHESHDLELIARAAAGDAAPGEVTAAAQLAAGCGECTALAADLRILVAATRELGSWTAAAPRDFRLNAEQADRTRSPRVRVLATLRDLAAGRRLATGLMTIGLAGLLLSAAAPTWLAGAAGGAAETSAGAAVDQAPAVPPLSIEQRAAPVPDAPESSAGYGQPPLKNAAESPVAPFDLWAAVRVAAIAAILAGAALRLSTGPARREGP